MCSAPSGCGASSPLAVKVAYQSFSFGFIAVCRLAVGTLVFAVVQAASGRKLPGDAVPLGQPVPARLHLSGTAWVFVAGVAIGGDLLLYTLGLRYTTASAATLIVSTDAVLLTLFGVLLLRERMSWLKAVAAFAALCGLVLVGWNGQDLSALVHSPYLLGNVFVLCAGLCWATYGVGQRVLASTRGSGLFPIFLVGTAVAGAGALMVPPIIGPIRWQAVGALAFLGLGGTGLAYVLLAKGMQTLEVATVGLVSATVPLFTMTEAYLLAGERMTGYLLAGAGLIISGAVLVVRHQRIYGQP